MPKEKDPFKQPINHRREITYSLAGAVLTSIACSIVIATAIPLALAEWRAGKFWGAVDGIMLALFFSLLVYGNLVYLINRAAYYHRLRRHRPLTQRELEVIYDHPDRAPAVTFLIPSYKEEPRVIRQAMLSAYLQDYPNRRIVLLMDDPQHPTDPDDRLALMTARAMPRHIQTSLQATAHRMQEAYRNYLARRASSDADAGFEHLTLADLHMIASVQFEQLATEYDINDHTDRHFVQLSFADRIADHRQRAHEHFLKGVGVSELSAQWATLAHREYARLARLFHAEITTFERKRYENLSHAPNKAMNLNSYISLIGKRFIQVERDGGCYLEPCAPDEQADLAVPDATYLVNLDADSTLAPNYTLKLVHEIEQHGNERTAIMQTPYTAIPNPPGVLERVAGATTDMQYTVSEGFTLFGAASWVGANSLIRKAALDDILTYDTERGHTISKYIQDRTVIEDTESTIDLIDRGWTLYGYPERLSYSATPSDFGSLVVQRCRWANGGLIILPKLLRYLAKAPASLKKIVEALLRMHYLSRSFISSLGYIMIFTFPLKDYMSAIWCLPLVGLPFQLLYLRDLRMSHYRVSDFLRALTFDLILIPLNMVGVVQSIQQMITGRQIPFMRTPKVPGRTAAPAAIVLAEFSLWLYCISATVFSLLHASWLNAIFPLAHSVMFWYAIRTFIGFRNSISDVYHGIFPKRSADDQRDDDRTDRQPPHDAIALPLPGVPHPARLAMGAVLLATMLGTTACAHAEEPSATTVPVLMYHKVSTDPHDEPDHTLIRIDRFKEQMQYLADHGYTTVTVSELVECMQGKRQLPEKSVVLTFDDAWKSTLDAVPVLEQHKFKATFLIATDMIDRHLPAHLSWDELRRIAANPNFEFGAHSISHPWQVGNTLVSWAEGKTQGRTLDDVTAEIVEPKRAIEQQLQRDVKIYAWPSGWYNDRLIRMAKEAGYTGLLTIDKGLNKVGGDPLKTKRYTVFGFFELAQFEQLLQRDLDDTAFMSLIAASPTTRAVTARGDAMVPQGPGALVLSYQQIVTDDTPQSVTVMPLERLKEQVQYLADHDYQTLTIGELAECVQGKRPLPERAVALTFDGGWKSALNAVPVLNQHNFKATFFLITGAADGVFGPSYLTWPEIEELAKNPRFEIGAMTLSHPSDPSDNLTTWLKGQNPGKSLVHVFLELKTPKVTLEHRLERPVTTLAWPGGWQNSLLRQYAKDTGYAICLTSEAGANYKGDDERRIKRFFVHGAWDLNAFQWLLEKQWYPVGAVETSAAAR